MIYQFETNVEFCLGSISAFLEFEIILNIKKKTVHLSGTNSWKNKRTWLSKHKKKKINLIDLFGSKYINLKL